MLLDYVDFNFGFMLLITMSLQRGNIPRNCFESISNSFISNDKKLNLRKVIENNHAMRIDDGHLKHKNRVFRRQLISVFGFSAFVLIHITKKKKTINAHFSDRKVFLFVTRFINHNNCRKVLLYAKSAHY